VPNAGYLDPTFGAAGAGLVTSGAGDVLIQPADGKVLALNGSTLARYNTNGSLDTSFGSGGIASYGGNSAALLSDGQILLAGFASSGFSQVRLNSNGSLDTSFGNQGVVTTAFPNKTGEPQVEIVVQPDGKIVLASAGWTTASKRGNYYVPYLDLARYNADGSLDAAFGNQGTVVTSLSSLFTSYTGGQTLSVDSLLLQANGELIVLANGHWPHPGYPGLLMARYNTNGSLDGSFGNQGIVTSSSQGGTGGAVLYPNAGTPNDGKIAIVGANAGIASGPWLVRFNTNGSLDSTFGSSGYVPLALSAGGVAFDSSGRFVVSGWTGVNGNSTSDAALERLNADGTPDSTFGSGGVVTEGIPGTSAGGTPAIYPNAGTDTADYGKIVTAGSYVARFLPSAPPSAPSFVVTVPSSVTAGVPFSVTVTATDASGNVLTSYTGTVDFADLAALDPQAVLPTNYTFTAADQGVHIFTVTFYKAIDQALFVADTTTPTMNGRDLSIPVNPGAVAGFVLYESIGSSSVRSGSSFVLYARAVDAYGNVTSFSGTVHLSSSDPHATLPGDETYPGNDAPLGTCTLRTKGTQTITIIDDADPSITGTLTLQAT
jgi:uncharacterized delta-60 repeat protein